MRQLNDYCVAVAGGLAGGDIISAQGDVACCRRDDAVRQLIYVDRHVRRQRPSVDH